MQPAGSLRQGHRRDGERDQGGPRGQHRLTLMPESLYLASYIVDRYLSGENVPKKGLQLVGASAMLVASKYEEICAALVGTDAVCWRNVLSLTVELVRLCLTTGQRM
jgi:hypothetical protein